jgi:hypothetical protein
MVTYKDKVCLNSWITGNTNGSNSVVELGAGFFGKLTAVHPSVPKKIGIEIWESYITSSDCSECIKIHGDILEFEKLIDKEDMDCCMVVDVLEHFEKDTAIDLVQRIKNNFNKFLLMVPEGNHPQNGDVTGHGADEYQKHRSTWGQDDLEKLGFDQIILDELYHPGHGGKDTGCLFAVWLKK